MSGSRWPRALSLAWLIGLAVLCSTPADAQVFKPRTGKGAPVARPTPAAPVAKKPAPAAPAASTSKKPTRTTGPTPRRVGKAAPPKKPARHARPKPDDDSVVVDDDDDSDVSISDD